MTDDWRDIEDLQRVRYCEYRGHRFDEFECVICGEPAPAPEVEVEMVIDRWRDAQRVTFGNDR